MPYWAATGYTPQGYVKHIADVVQWQRDNPGKILAYAQTKRRLNKELYGGDPSQNIHARVKWMEEREAKRKAKAAAMEAEALSLQQLQKKKGKNKPKK